MQWKEGDIEGVVMHPIKRMSDSRGWLAEIFRSDEIAPDLLPAMSYLSVTHPDVIRGPHEHREQTDIFAFFGPGTFKLKLWDNRKDSSSYGNTMIFIAGEDNPMSIILPPGIIHGYRNISDHDAWMSNYPNKLFAGEGKKDPIDEIRHEDDESNEFSMD